MTAEVREGKGAAMTYGRGAINREQRESHGTLGCLSEYCVTSQVICIKLAILKRFRSDPVFKAVPGWLAGWLSTSFHFT